jgi:GT2 family glycosyltransferase
MNAIARESVCIVIPVYNRLKTTLKCLETLQQQGNLQRYRVVVIDDGSTDGTKQAIESLYTQVTILPGNGNLWWTGAIAKGMQYAFSQGDDFFIWLNDDTLPETNTIAAMVSRCQQHSNLIVTAQCYQSQEMIYPTYGGHKKNLLSLTRLFAKPNTVIQCDCTNGNLVCFPRSAIEKIGYPNSEKFPQALADVIYTWQAKQAGFHIEILGDARAICQFNPMEANWLTSSIPMRSRWKILNSPKSNLYPRAYWHYCQFFYGILGIIPFIQAYVLLTLFTVIKIFIPLEILKQIKTIKNKITWKEQIWQ